MGPPIDLREAGVRWLCMAGSARPTLRPEPQRPRRENIRKTLAIPGKGRYQIKGQDVGGEQAVQTVIFGFIMGR